MSKQKIFMASDHAAYQFKLELKEALSSDYEIEDLGSDSDERVDYPDFAQKLADQVTRDENALGLLLCGTGQGMAMAANKVNGIRAAVCSDTFSAQMTRAHNKANVLCLGARVIGPGLALEICKSFLNSEFEGGRHAARVEKIMALEKK